MTPPFVPNVQSSTDTQYFDQYEELEPWMYEGEEILKKDYNFIGYTYKMESEPEKNFVKEEMDRMERVKDREREKEKER